MASGTGIYLAAKWLSNLLALSTAYTYGSQVDFALYTTGGITSAGAGTEVSGTGYARFAGTLTAGALFTTTATATISNNTTIAFAAAGGTWTVAVTLAIFEHGNNNLLLYGDLGTSKTLTSGDVFQFTAGNLSVTLS